VIAAADVGAVALENAAILEVAVAPEGVVVVPKNVETSPGHRDEEERKERMVVDPQASFVTTH